MFYVNKNFSIIQSVQHCYHINFAQNTNYGTIKPVYMIKTKVAFLKGRLLSTQSEQCEKFSKSLEWLEKSRPSKKATFALIM